MKYSISLLAVVAMVGLLWHPAYVSAQNKDIVALQRDIADVARKVDAIQKELVQDGFVRRYQIDGNVDGLAGSERTFLMTTFWLADNLALMGRGDEAREIFERLRAIRNDVGLLSEEYDPSAARMLGNFPQAFSHVSLINTAANLSTPRGPSLMRSGRVGVASRHQR